MRDEERELREEERILRDEGLGWGFHGAGRTGRGIKRPEGIVRLAHPPPALRYIEAGGLFPYFFSKALSTMSTR